MKARDATLVMGQHPPRSKKMKGKKTQSKMRRSTQSPGRAVPVNINVEALMEGISLSQLEDDSFEDGMHVQLHVVDPS